MLIMNSSWKENQMNPIKWGLSTVQGLLFMSFSNKIHYGSDGNYQKSFLNSISTQLWMWTE